MHCYLKKNSHIYGKLSSFNSIKQMFACQNLVLGNLKLYVTLNSLRS